MNCFNTFSFWNWGPGGRRYSNSRSLSDRGLNSCSQRGHPEPQETGSGDRRDETGEDTPDFNPSLFRTRTISLANRIAFRIQLSHLSITLHRTSSPSPSSTGHDTLPDQHFHLVPVPAPVSAPNCLVEDHPSTTPTYLYLPPPDPYLQTPDERGLVGQS